MKQSPQIEARINEIAKELAKGKDRAELLRTFAKKWHIAQRTVDRYLKPAKIIAISLSKKANKAAEAAYIQAAGEAVKIGLKTKLERLIILQKMCSDTEKELELNVSTDYIVIAGKLQKVAKEISVTDRAYMRKTLRDLQAEISKIEGDYAPNKLELNKLDLQVNLSMEEIKNISKALDESN